MEGLDTIWPLCRGSRAIRAAVSSASRRAVSLSPLRTGRGQSHPGRSARTQRGGAEDGGREGGGANFTWGKTMMAIPVCGIILKASQGDTDTRECLVRCCEVLAQTGGDARGLVPLGASRVLCEAAAAASKPPVEPVLTAAEMAAEMERSTEVHKQLLKELERVRAERDALEEQRRALQDTLEESAKRPPAKIVQQEVKFAESWDAKIAEILAVRTTERVLELMQQPVAAGEDATPSSSLALGVIGNDGVDLSKEPGLAENATVESAQQRLRALLLELHHRTRLEGIRVSEAVKSTEEAVTRQHMVALSQKMSEQEAYVQQLTEAKTNEIRDRTLKELRERDVEFRRALRQQWAKINEESRKLAEHNVKLKSLHYSLSREDDLARAKKELADFYTSEAQEAALQMLQAQEKVKAFDQTVKDDALKAGSAQAVHRLALALAGLVSDMSTHRPLASHVSVLKKLASHDQVVATVAGSIPTDALKEGIGK